MDDPWADVDETGEWVRRLCASRRPDVLHMNTFAPVHSRTTPVLLTAHSCVLSWWRAVHGVEAPAQWSRYRHLVARALKSASLLTTPSSALLDQLAAVYGTLPAARVIANGEDVRGELHDTRHRERLVVCAGRVWDAGKNAELVAQAAPGIDGRVVLIGAGELSGGDAESIGPLPQSELLRWLRRAAVFAEPARYEPFGLAALEAAGCGCALVLGDIPSLREVWGDAATFVDPDDHDALAAEVNRLLDDPARRLRAARAALARASLYTTAPMADGYLAAYRQLGHEAVAA
jgi:glycosyltransferase involved in cell wall biosynthesis